ncbi:Gfo/Idh/MocA family oxidoreductase [Termitidicoccus mucosus]|uniref:Oxidoreductase n=1 Tax=Termitidicoccus mucosus TaxID=1184151 RepID=A0A178IMK4_9BACT|nr:hypothetical protein AW736_05065 [Opitutaceae bacterium TSB47]
MNPTLHSDSSKALRMAFFAVGGMALNHLKAIAQRGDVRVVAMCDLSEDALAAARAVLAEHYAPSEIASIRTTTNAMAMAGDVDCDCAFLSIPNPARIPVAKRLVARSIPLLMEKPAAHSLEDFEALLAGQRKTGAVVMVSQNYRYTPGALLVRRLLRQGEVGKVETVAGLFLRNHLKASRFYYGKLPGPVPFRIEMVIHHMDMVAAWLGASPERVAADGFRTPISWGVGDTGCDVLARFSNGARLNYHGDWSAASSVTGWNGQWTVTGSMGVLTWQGENRVCLRRRHADPFCDDGEWVEFQAARSEDSLTAIHTEFFTALHEGRMPESSLEENAASFRLCLQAATQNILR